MRDSPNCAQLLTEVEAALRAGIEPGFEQRVTANAVALARREAALADAAEQAELGRLVALLGRPGALEDLNRELCEAIRERRLRVASPGLLDHLRATTREKMRIDQPNYPAFRADEPANED